MDAFALKWLATNRQIVPPEDIHLDEFEQYPDIYADAPAQQERESTYQVSIMRQCPLVPPMQCSYEVTLQLKNKTRAELERVFRRLADEPFNARWMQQAQCFINTMAAEFSAPSSDTSRTRALASGANGVVARGVFPSTYAPLLFPTDKPPAFVLKVGLEAADDGDDTLNELLVGLYGLNRLRERIPTFMYVYGGYRCGAPEIAGTKVTTCLDSAHPVVYSMIETIADAMTFHAALWEGKFTVEDVASVVSQVLLALQVAKDELDFSHNDLSAGNVMVRFLDRPVTLSFVTHGGRETLVVTRVIATIIDFGRSHIAIAPIPSTVDRTTLRPTSRITPRGAKLNLGHVWLRYGQFPSSPSSLFDVVFFLCNSIVFSAKPHLNYQSVLYGFLLPLFTDRDVGRAIKYVTHAAANWPVVTPFDRDIDPIALVDDFREHAEVARTVLFNEFDAQTMPPLFSCSGSGGVCNRSLSDV